MKIKNKYIFNIIRMLMILLAFLLLFLNNNQLYSAEQTTNKEELQEDVINSENINTIKNDNIESTTTNNDEILIDNNNGGTLDYLIQRKDNIEEKLGINEQTDSEKNVEDIKNKIKDKEIEIGVLEENTGDNEQKKKETEKKILDEKNKIKKFESEIKKLLSEGVSNSSDLINELNYKIELLETSIGILKENKQEIENKLKIAKIKEDGLKIEVEEYIIYKKKYEELVKKEKIKDKQQFYKHLYTYIFILILFGLLLLLSKKIKNKYKDKNKKLVDNLYMIDVLLWIILFFITIIYVLIIKPEIALVFILLGGGLLLSIRPLISSFFSSISILANYNLGDTIKIGEIQGQIVKITPIHTRVRVIDDNGKRMDKIIILPNKFFIEKSIEKIKTFLIRKEISITFSLKNSEKKFDTIIKDIDNIFYKNNIDIIDYSTKKRYFMSIKQKSGQEFELNLSFDVMKDLGQNIEIELISYFEEIELNKKEEEEEIKVKESNENR